jgi:hypothetical protein
MTPIEKATQAAAMLREAVIELLAAKPDAEDFEINRTLGLFGTGMAVISRVLCPRDAKPLGIDGEGKVNLAALAPKSGPCGAC